MSLNTILLQDAFDDNSFDTDKWVESTNAGSLVAEQNGRLEMAGNANLSCFIRSKNAFIPRNSEVIAKVSQHCTNGGIKFCPTIVINHQWDVYSEANWYNLQTDVSTTLSPNVKDAGSTAQVGGNSPTLTVPYWVRMRIYDKKIYFDYCSNRTEMPGPQDWINISSEDWDMGTNIDQAQYLYISGYNTPSTGVSYWNNFVWRRLKSPFPIFHPIV